VPSFDWTFQSTEGLPRVAPQTATPADAHTPPMPDCISHHEQRAVVASQLRSRCSSHARVRRSHRPPRPGRFPTQRSSASLRSRCSSHARARRSHRPPRPRRFPTPPQRSSASTNSRCCFSRSDIGSPYRREHEQRRSPTRHPDGDANAHAGPKAARPAPGGVGTPRKRLSEEPLVPVCSYGNSFSRGLQISVTEQRCFVCDGPLPWVSSPGVWVHPEAACSRGCYRESVKRRRRVQRVERPVRSAASRSRRLGAMRGTVVLGVASADTAVARPRDSSIRAAEARSVHGRARDRPLRAYLLRPFLVRVWRRSGGLSLVPSWRVARVRVGGRLLGGRGV
jgi:hypothetical protein